MSATTILCWLNASKTEGNNTLRLVPQAPTPFLPDGKCVFLNLSNKQVQKTVAESIRQSFGKVSYTFMLDFTKVTMRTSGFSITMDSSAFKAGVTKSEVAEQTLTADDEAVLDIFGASSDDDTDECF